MSDQIFHTNIDHQGEIKIQPVATLPVSATSDDKRRLIYTLDTNKLYWSNGSTWSELSRNSAPVGSIIPFGGAEGSIPSESLLCNGQAVSTTTYADLFAIIGYTYGGSGSTFNVPDLRGRSIAGKDNMGGSSADRLTGAWADTLGGADGAETHQLTEAEMPSHTHNTGSTPDGTATGGADIVARPVTVGANKATSSTGSDAAHNNVQPTMTVNYIIIALER